MYRRVANVAYYYPKKWYMDWAFLPSLAVVESGVTPNFGRGPLQDCTFSHFSPRESIELSSKFQ